MSGHDKLCPFFELAGADPDAGLCPYCFVIPRVRADEREKWEPMVKALTDELLAKAQPDMSMGAQYLAGVAVGQRDEREAAAQRVIKQQYWTDDESQMDCISRDGAIAAVRAAP